MATFSVGGLVAPTAGHGPIVFGLQAPRIGIGIVVESTLAAFANALEFGAGTLEPHVQFQR